MKILLLLLGLLLSLDAKEKILVLHAGSLAVPFAEMEKAFEAKYPRYDVVREASGSRSAARKVSELGKKADLVASADYRVIDELLIPDYAKFNVRFAGNEMVLAYTPRSRYAREIDAKNWPEILLKKSVRVGHSNPNLDPCGYRSILTVKLAEKHYKIPGFYAKLLGYGESYRNGEERRGGRVVVRPKETDLLALLESGIIDYLFIYRSLAEQHGLPYVTLPPEVNLGSPKLNPLYRQVAFKISGKKPGEWIPVHGEAMLYGFTIPQNATLPPHPEGAVRFARFILSDEGRAILEKNGQRVIAPPRITGDASILKKPPESERP